ncbi:MAG TPA: hypothetical protein VK654_04405 [Nitrospirota bacterium]|nr:hypothetical protein [Nitrospirota bacterium]
MAENWKLIANDKKFDYYLDATGKTHTDGPRSVTVKAVCSNKELFMDEVWASGKPLDDYEKYSHSIIAAKIDCSKKKYLVEVITEYDTKGNVIDHVAGAMTNWLDASEGTFGKILYDADCHKE